MNIHFQSSVISELKCTFPWISNPFCTITELHYKDFLFNLHIIVARNSYILYVNNFYLFNWRQLKYFFHFFVIVKQYIAYTQYKIIMAFQCNITSKINVTPKGDYLAISKLYSILANLLAHNNKSKICYCGQINCSFFWNLTPLRVTFILLAMVHGCTHFAVQNKALVQIL